VLVQSVFMSVEWPTELTGHGPLFIDLKRNILVGVSEVWTCLVRAPDMSAVGT
jgi:hypothetical protein